MRVFLSWSGAQSLRVATALRDWLPLVLQECDPWLSSEDIRKGSRWQDEVANALNNATAAVLCLTRSSLGSPWLLFEAGAVSKVVSAAPTYVCAYLIDLADNDVSLPLSMFQSTAATAPDTLRLVHALNQLMDRPLPDTRVEKLFEKFWPDLQREIDAAKADSVAPVKVHRAQDEMMDELLTLMRDLMRRLPGERIADMEQRIVVPLRETLRQQANPAPDASESARRRRREQLDRSLQHLARAVVESFDE